MPILPNLDDFPYVGQEEGELTCVPACVEMVCKFWGISKTEDEIRGELDYHVADGTPFGNIELLSGVRLVRVADVEEISLHLANRCPRPVVANLFIQEPVILGYASQSHMLHAVVLSGSPGAT